MSSRMRAAEGPYRYCAVSRGPCHHDCMLPWSPRRWCSCWIRSLTSLVAYTSSGRSVPLRYKPRPSVTPNERTCPSPNCLASDFVSDIRVVITPHPVGSSGLEREGGDDPTGLRTRPSWAPRQAVPEPEPEVRAVVAAGDRRAEPERGGRALWDRPVDGHARPSGRQAGCA